MRKQFASLIGLLLLCLNSPSAQTKPSLEGVWKVAEVVWPQEGDRIVTHPQPGLMIFTRGYYSTITVMGGQPRTAAAAAKDPAHLTDAEKIARFEEWRPFGASSGTYEIQGSTVIRRVIVAKTVRVMSRATPNIWEFKLEGHDTLWLIPTGDLKETEPNYRLARLE